MADTITAERRSWNMSRIKGANTAPEKQLRSLLHAAGYRFRLHHSQLPGRPDIVLPRYRAAVFVHGCFWHRHSGCRYATTPSTREEFWIGKFAATVARDARKEQELAAAGWRVITVWECELANDPDGALAGIIRQLMGQR
jgi:DNA mismatch endonuclease, patch repair protein